MEYHHKSVHEKVKPFGCGLCERSHHRAHSLGMRVGPLWATGEMVRLARVGHLDRRFQVAPLAPAIAGVRSGRARTRSADARVCTAALVLLLSCCGRAVVVRCVSVCAGDCWCMLVGGGVWLVGEVFYKKFCNFFGD